MKASEARKISEGSIQLTEREVFRGIKRVAHCGLVSTAFVRDQLSDRVKKKLRKEGYKLVEDETMITVIWNG